MTSDELLALRDILVRILNATDSWPIRQSLELSEVGEAEDAEFSEMPGWNTAGHHAKRLAGFNFRKLDPDIFKPSPSEWWRAMRDAANKLVVYSGVIPSTGLMEYRFALLGGLEDVQAAWDDAYSREAPERIQRLICEVAGTCANGDPSEPDLEPESDSKPGHEAEVDELGLKPQSRKRTAKQLALRAVLYSHHCPKNELIESKPLTVKELAAKLKDWSKSGKEDDGFVKPG